MQLMLAGYIWSNEPYSSLIQRVQSHTWSEILLSVFIHLFKDKVYLLTLGRGFSMQTYLRCSKKHNRKCDLIGIVLVLMETVMVYTVCDGLGYIGGVLNPFGKMPKTQQKM